MQFITSNFLPISLALTSGLMFVWSLFGNRIKGIKEVDVQGAVQLINHKNAFVLDVREPSEYKAGHLLNSRLIPLGKLKESIGEIEKYKDVPVVVVCRSGNRSGMACGVLKKLGFSQTYNMAGGMLAWQKANLPTQK
ncbi:MAG: rhodanese-like domain-containing protein [Gallionella sp.]|nr:rhodanese-like domain-containing protein [Gallionella sp.]MDD5611600.1 rhodanese-like domain-containing protein [Gallionella sp.]